MFLASASGILFIVVARYMLVISLCAKMMLIYDSILFKNNKETPRGAPIENTNAANAKERKLKVKPSFTNSLLI